MTYAPNLAGTRLLTLKLATVDWSAQVTGARITSAAADSDITTFADAAAGGSRQYQLTFTGVADYQASSLWDEVFSNAGTSVAFILAPYGVAASVTAPTFTGNAIIAEPDGDFIGGDADASTTSRFTFDCAWDLTAKPARVTS